MAVVLEKGQNISLESGLTKVKVGMGWNPRCEPGDEFDLDASCFLLNAEKKVRSDADFIFYNHPTSSCGSVKYQGDNRNGVGEGDDEQILVDLSQVPADVERIVFTATIYKSNERGQNFGQVDNSYIRLVDMTNDEEIAKFELGEDASTSTALVFGELYRRNGAWKFRALGQGYTFELGSLACSYGVSLA